MLFAFLHGKAQNSLAPKKATMNAGLAQYISLHPNGAELIHVLVEGNSPDAAAAIEQCGGVVRYSCGLIFSAAMPVNKIAALLQFPSVKRIEALHGSGRVLDSETDTNTNVHLVKAGALPLPQGYDGSGVVIGIIDDGLDLSHPDFSDAQGNTRVKYLWSQTDTTGGTTPSYGYGQEWDSAAIDAGCPYISTAANFGHGSIVTGIAAGNGLAVHNYYGVATNADIIFVAVDFSQNFLNNVADAAEYIYAKAAALGKPCVINASVGSYAGSHDGNDLPAKMIDALVTQQNGRAFVCAAGNAGNVLLHLGYPVQQDSLFTWFKYEPTIGRVYFEVWAEQDEFKDVQFAIGADKAPAPYQFRGRTPFFNILSDFNLPLGTTTVKDTLWSGNKILGAVEIIAEKIDSVYHLGISVFTDSTNYNWRFITFGSGYFDCWSQPTYTGTSNIVKANLPSAGAFPDIVRYKRPDKTQNIVSSFTCSDKTITVANYNNKSEWLDVNNQVRTPGNYAAPPSVDTVAGTLGTTSSVGPTRDGRMKPDISAPGNFTFGSGLLSLMPSFIANNPGKVGVGGKHILDGGTSMASPVVTGIVALYLQKRPDASWQEIKDVLLSTAKHDAFTTDSLPNAAWGYGKADAFAMINYYGCKDHNASNFDSLAVVDDGSCIYYTGANKVLPEVTFFNYPNPFAEHTTLHYQVSFPFESGAIAITDLLGNELSKTVIHSPAGNINFVSPSLASGIYFCKLIADGKIVSVRKMIVF